MIYKPEVVGRQQKLASGQISNKPGFILSAVEVKHILEFLQDFYTVIQTDNMTARPAWVSIFGFRKRKNMATVAMVG